MSDHPDRDVLASLCARCDAMGCRGALSAVRLGSEGATAGGEIRELLGESVVACADAAGPAPAERIRCVDELIGTAGCFSQSVNYLGGMLADLVNYRRAADGRTMLLVCALQNRHDLIRHLVAKYGDVLDTLLSTKLGETPLYLASRWNNMKCVEALLSHTSSAERQTNRRVEDGTDFTCLHLACFHGKVDLASLLLLGNNNANVHAVDSRGDQPLHLAARHGHPDIVEMLVRAGASLNHCNSRGSRPVDTAIAAGKLECQLLLYEFMEAEAALAKQNCDATSLPPIVSSANKNALTPSSKHMRSGKLRRTGRIIPDPPFSFSPDSVKRAYASTPFHFRASSPKVDDVRGDYLPRFLKVYAMMWPESLLPKNRAEA
eukprot:g2995.t1